MDNEWKARVIDLEMRVAKMERQYATHIKRQGAPVYVPKDLKELWTARRDMVEEIIFDLVAYRPSRHRLKSKDWRSIYLSDIVRRIDTSALFDDAELPPRSIVLALLKTIPDIMLMTRLEALSQRINTTDDLVIVKKAINIRRTRKKLKHEQALTEIAFDHSKQP